VGSISRAASSKPAVHVAPRPNTGKAKRSARPIQAYDIGLRPYASARSYRRTRGTQYPAGNTRRTTGHAAAGVFARQTRHSRNGAEMRPRMLHLRNNAESSSNHASIFGDLAGHYRRGLERHKMSGPRAARKAAPRPRNRGATPRSEAEIASGPGADNLDRMVSMTLRTFRARRKSRTLLPLVLGGLLGADGLAQTPDEDAADEPPLSAEQADETLRAPRAGGSLDEDEGDAGADVTDALRELPDLLGSAADDPEQAAASPHPVTRLETLLEVNRLADAGHPEEARPLLEQLIRLTEEEF